MFFTRKGEVISLTDHLGNVPAVFIIGGGPSANELELEKLNQRGVWSLAINNVAGHPRFCPSAFICADPPKKFHTGIWLDPNVMKFIPRPKLKVGRGGIRRKVGEEFEATGFSACHCPNVWAVDRRTWLEPDDTFFTDKQASWGNLNAGCKRTGQPKTACTFLLALRIAHELGARRIHLIGVDFKMSEGSGYSFAQKRDQGAITTNNNQFNVVGNWLGQMANEGVFERADLKVFNTNPDAALSCFPHMPFEDALTDCLEGFPEQPFDLEGWYEK
jgi:hypothetical protein